MALIEARERARLHKLCEGAAKPPWRVIGNTVWFYQEPGTPWLALPGDAATVEFISAAREALPAMLDAYEDLLQELNQLRELELADGPD